MLDVLGYELMIVKKSNKVVSYPVCQFWHTG